MGTVLKPGHNPNFEKKIPVHQTKIQQASDSFKLTNVMACTTPENLVKIEQKLLK